MVTFLFKYPKFDIINILITSSNINKLYTNTKRMIESTKNQLT